VRRFNPFAFLPEFQDASMRHPGLLGLVLAVLLSLAACASAPPAIEYSSARTEEPQSIHWIEVDPTQVQLEAAVARDQVLGRETTSSMARRHGASAAVNGGFFVVQGPFAGDFDGLFVWNGRIVSEPVHQRSSFAFCSDGRVWIDAFSLTTRVHLGGTPVGVDGINRHRSKGEVILFSPAFGPTTINRGPELVVAEGKIVGVSDGGSRIPADGFVLALNEVPSGVEPGAEVHLEHRLTARGSGQDIESEGCSFVSAGPALIREGRVLEDHEAESSKFGPGFSLKRHPRTGVGIRKDGSLIFVVVDGRQEGLSVGMTLPELARLLKDNGAYDAYNLDGGGSSTMVVNGRVVNSPSDEQGERPSSDAIIIKAR
jgi:exopolysaccharide biosynthesis protein